MSEVTPAPAPEPTPAPVPVPVPTPPDEKTAAELAEIKKQFEAAQSALAAYKKKEEEEENKKKSAEQQLAELTAKFQKAERDNLVTKLAIKKGLDIDLIDRVRGDSEKDIEADIDLLLAKFAPKKESDPEPKPAPGGKKQPAKTDETPKKTGNTLNDALSAWLKGATA